MVALLVWWVACVATAPGCQIVGFPIELRAGHSLMGRNGASEAVEKPHSCHPFDRLRASSERSEGSSNSRRIILSKILRCAQNDERRPSSTTPQSPDSTRQFDTGRHRRELPVSSFPDHSYRTNSFRNPARCLCHAVEPSDGTRLGQFRSPKSALSDRGRCGQ